MNHVTRAFANFLFLMLCTYVDTVHRTTVTLLSVPSIHIIISSPTITTPTTAVILKVNPQLRDKAIAIAITIATANTPT
ncbi:hypothetical protein BGAL_0007g00360 [Botrytis galanthina]|uniref:Secreted protein n=1 Tax=Botrytis galanthina TaxID=278940 RepID=A0A4S8RFV6_9HELO|nr:hypothetical protein BGAL_0007g00360 [Botrytis galanthina]